MRCPRTSFPQLAGEVIRIPVATLVAPSYAEIPSSTSPSRKYALAPAAR
jgi:hypothetical protein